MTQKNDLELRILTGLHAKARTHIAQGERIGSDPENEVVLDDPGLPAKAATVSLYEEGWCLDQGEIIPWNHPAQFGPVWLCVSQPADPWVAAPSDPTRTARAAAKLDVTASEAPIGLGHDPQAGPSTPKTMTAVFAKTPETIVRHIGQYRMPLAALALLLTLAGLLSSLYFLRAGPSVSEQASTLNKAQASLDRIRVALEELSLQDTLHASLDPGSTQARVSGWVKDNEQFSALSQAMTRIWPMPALKVYIESQITQEIDQALASIPLRYHSTYLGNGQVSIQGIAPDTETRAAVQNQLQQRWADISFSLDGLFLGSELSDRLKGLLAQQGLHAQPVWHDGLLYVQSDRLSATERRQLMALVQAFNQQYGSIARPYGPGSSNGVPFEIRSIVGGPQPYLVLEDGRKWLPGGHIEGYRLNSIQAENIIFDVTPTEGSDQADIRR